MYTKLQFGYNVLATRTTSAHKGGVALFWRADATSWHVEDPHQVSPNTIAAILVSGHQCWIIIGTYMSPNDDLAEHIRDITNTRN